MTAHTPPKPPAARLRNPCSDFCCTTSTSFLSASLLSGTWGKWSAMTGGRLSIFLFICAPVDGDGEDMTGRGECAQRIWEEKGKTLCAR
jgi:hypothetical protein